MAAVAAAAVLAGCQRPALDLAEPQPAELVEAQRPPAALVELQSRMVADRAALQDGAPPQGMPRPIVATGGKYDLDLDEERDIVIVWVHRPTRALRRSFRRYYEFGGIRLEAGVSTPHG